MKKAISQHIVPPYINQGNDNYETLENNFKKELEKYASIWKEDPDLKENIDALTRYKELEWQAISDCKTAWTTKHIEMDFSVEKINLEETQIKSQKKANISNIFTKEKELIDNQAKSYIENNKNKITDIISKIHSDDTPKSSSRRPGSWSGSSLSLSTNDYEKVEEKVSNQLLSHIEAIIKAETKETKDSSSLELYNCKKTEM